MTQILKTTKVAKKVNATASDDKYNYAIEYSVTEDENKTLEGLSVTANTIGDDSSYAGTVTLVVGSGDRSLVLKEGADGAVISAMVEAIIAEVKSSLTV